jgi:hypothetical protein
MGMKNAHLLTGDHRYLDAAAHQLSNLRKGVKIGERPDGRPVTIGLNFQVYWMAMDLYLMTGDEQYDWFMKDWKPGRWQPGEPMYSMGYTRDWLAWLRGRYPGFPEKMLEHDFAWIKERMERIRNDDSTDWEREASMLRRLNPVATPALTMLTTGGREPSWRGSRLICRLRYFDPHRGRPGLPTGVAALVDSIDDSEVAVQFVNISDKARTVVVQGGAYGEHHITSVWTTSSQPKRVNARVFAVTLGPHVAGRLRMGMKRFANTPTLSSPLTGGRERGRPSE